MPDRAFDDLVQFLGGGETEAIEMYGHDAEAKLRAGAPAILQLDGEWTAIARVAGDRVTLIGAGQTKRTIPLAGLWSQLARDAAAPHRAAIEAILDRAAIPASRRDRAFDAILRERIHTAKLGFLHPVRTHPGSSFARQLRETGVLRNVAALFLAHAAEFSCWLAAWWVLGAQALSGRADSGSLAAWALLLVTMVPFRMLSTWLQGSIAIAGGGLLRQRLLAGALKLDPEEVRHEGAGSFLARAIEAESIEALALGGGIASALAVFELLLSALVLYAGAARILELPLLVLWTTVTFILGALYWRSRERWTAARLSITHDLIERMTGHRTRLAQQPSSEWHDDEDRALSGYAALSGKMDSAAARLSALAPRGWLFIAIAGLTPAFVASAAVSPAALAIALGGILLAWQAFRRLAFGLAQLSGAIISWRQVSLLFHAAARPVDTAAEVVASGETVVDARDLSFHYPGRHAAVLNSASLSVRRGDWVLLEGESGGGKSTFSALLAGLRKPTSGLLLRWGTVAAAPQFHENHVLTGTFAFNLLMGRCWPPSEEDFKEAENVARELGLGPLLERMPGGMLQMVGETGWQLSQGERSRVFLARALLQNPDFVILDESFAALDPENLRSSLECALKRSKTLMVVAHP